MPTLMIDINNQVCSIKLYFSPASANSC